MGAKWMSAALKADKRSASSTKTKNRRIFAKANIWLYAVIGIPLIIGCAILIYPFEGDEDETKIESVSKRKARIKEASTPSEKKQPHTEAQKQSVTKTYHQAEERVVPKLLTNVITNTPGRRVPRPVRVIRDENIRDTPPPIFRAMCDNHLEQLVNYQPGEPFLAIVSPAEIARDFMAHVADKIEISPDDPPEIAERKRAYAEVREDIKKEILAGADLEEMITEARRTLDKISNMRNEYLNILKEEEDGGASDDDLDDLASAASTLLKEHGANPILSPRQQMKLWEDQIREKLKEP